MICNYKHVSVIFYWLCIKDKFPILGIIRLYSVLNTVGVEIKSDVALSPGDHSMKFTVSDLCEQSTGILTIRVENDVSINISFIAFWS